MHQIVHFMDLICWLLRHFTRYCHCTFYIPAVELLVVTHHKHLCFMINFNRVRQAPALFCTNCLPFGEVHILCSSHCSYFMKMNSNPASECLSNILFTYTWLLAACFIRSACFSNKATANGVDLYYEKVGGGDHVVLLLPGALGEVSCN